MLILAVSCHMEPCPCRPRTSAPQTPTYMRGMECRRLSTATGEFHGLFAALVRSQPAPRRGLPKTTIIPPNGAPPKSAREWAVYSMPRACWPPDSVHWGCATRDHELRPTSGSTLPSSSRLAHNLPCPPPRHVEVRCRHSGAINSRSGLPHAV